MGAVTQSFGAASPVQERGSLTNTITGSTLALAANFSNATSGTAFGVRFTAPVSQSSANVVVYAFMTAKSGSPTAIVAGIWAGPSGAMDDDRPDTGAALSTVSVDVSGQAANSWTTFTIPSVSLTAGATYWLVIYNNTGTPASNNATYMTRGLASNNATALARLVPSTTTDGFTTDPGIVITGVDAAVVIKFSDGSIVGSPYTVSTSHASNQNYRGNRYNFAVPTKVSGVLNINASTSVSHIKVFQGANEVASSALDRSQLNNNQAVYFDSPVTFAANTDYDVVWDPSANVTVGNRLDAGTSPPADVLACMPSGLSYVDGATPGSFSEVDGMSGMFLLIDDIPAAAAGGGGGSFVFIG